MRGPVKFLCPDCERLISLEVFRVEGPALVVTCQKCGAQSRAESLPSAASRPARPVTLPPRFSLESTQGSSNVVVLRTAGHEATQKAARAADEGPFVLPEGVCPKCIAPRATTPSCPYCGILFESFDEATVLPPKWLRDEWVEVLRDWGNDAKHSQLRRTAQQSDALAAVGRLYRLRQAFVPEDPVAEEGRADVLRLAAAAISLRSAPDMEEQHRRKKVVLVSAVLVFTFLVSIVLLQLLGTD